MQEFKTVEELLSDSKRWTKGAFAKTEDGQLVPSWHHAAISWCLLGACRKIYGNDVDKYEEIYRNLVCDPVTWNDCPKRTHEEVLNLVKELGI